MKRKAHKYNLQKSSGFNLPLGLVLTLFMVYGLLESKTAIASEIPIINSFEIEDPYNFPDEIEFQMEKPKPLELKKELNKPPILDLINLVESVDNSEVLVKEKVISINRDNGSNNFSDEFTEVNPPEDIEDDRHLIMDLVDEVPIYPGCEKVKKGDKRDCFEKKLRKLVQKRFDGDLVNNLGLSPGKKNIYVKFVITKSGNIMISGSRAPHIALKKEGERIVRSIPKMIPGKQNGKEVNVTYMLPISLRVE